MGCVKLEVFFCEQKTAYERRISDWSSDVCSSDLPCAACNGPGRGGSDRTCRLLSAPRRWRRAEREMGAAPVLRNRNERESAGPREYASRPATTEAVREKAAPAGGNRGAAGHRSKFTKIGSASRRERGCQYVENAVIGVSLK